jgi:hypothetical protein
MSMKTKGVAFNLDDPDQKELFDWAMSRTNFSAYVKRLIQADRDQKSRDRGPVIKSAGGGIKFKIGE